MTAKKRKRVRKTLGRPIKRDKVSDGIKKLRKQWRVASRKYYEGKRKRPRKNKK